MSDLKNFGSWLYGIWMSFAKVLGYVNTRVILTLLYILVIGPISIIVRLVSKDILTRHFSTESTYWRKREAAEATIESSERQF